MLAWPLAGAAPPARCVCARDRRLHLAKRPPQRRLGCRGPGLVAALRRRLPARLYVGRRTRRMRGRSVRLRGHRRCGQVALQLQANLQRLCRGIASACGDRSRYRGQGLRQLRRGRLLLRQLQVPAQCGLGLPILVGVRLDRRDQLRHVIRVHRVVRHELRQIVLLVLGVDVEVEVRRVHPPDAQVRDVTHDAHRHRRVELCDVVVVLARELLHPPGPQPRVIVLRDQPLLCGVLERLDERLRLPGRVRVAGAVHIQPRHLVVAIVVEGLHQRLVVGKVGPVQHLQLLGRGRSAAACPHTRPTSERTASCGGDDILRSPATLPEHTPHPPCARFRSS